MRTLRVGGEGDPVLPEAQQRRALKIVNEINRHAQAMRRFDRRVNNLYLLKSFTHVAGHSLPMSYVHYTDHPVLQLLFERRDRYMRLQGEIACCRTVLENVSESDDRSLHNAQLAAITALAKLEAQADRELVAMEDCLQQIRREVGTHLHACQKFLTDLIRCSQIERLVKLKTGANDSDLTDDMLDAKIADAGE